MVAAITGWFLHRNCLRSSCPGDWSTTRPAAPWRSCLGLGSQVPFLHPTAWGCGGCACMKEDIPFPSPAPLAPAGNCNTRAAVSPWLSHGILLFDPHQCLIVPDEQVGAPRSAPLSRPGCARCRAHPQPRQLPPNRGLPAVPGPLPALRQDVLRPEKSGFVRNRSACDSSRRLLGARRGAIGRGGGGSRQPLGDAGRVTAAELGFSRGDR